MPSYKSAFLKHHWFDAETVNNTYTSAEEVLGLSTFALEILVTGSPSGCRVDLQGSIDGTNWLALPCSFNISAGPWYGYFVSTVQPVRYVRLWLTGLTGGSSPTVTASVIGV